MFLPRHHLPLRKSQGHPEAGTNGGTCTYHSPGNMWPVQGVPSGDWMDQITFQTKEEGWSLLRELLEKMLYHRELAKEGATSQD